MRFNYLCILSLAVSIAIGCSSTTQDEKLAKYVGDLENGLTKKLVVDSNTVICQLIPGQAQDNSENEVLKFRMYIRSDIDERNDSLMYFLNYRSSDMFQLIAEGDTLSPLISERIANGRTDMHEFTLLFPRPQVIVKNEEIQLLVNKNMLISKDILFEYRYNDITKASKNIYGYEQVQN